MRFGFASRPLGVGPLGESEDVSDCHPLPFGQQKKCRAESVVRINARWDYEGQRREGNGTARGMRRRSHQRKQDSH